MITNYKKIKCPLDKIKVKCPYEMAPEGITVHNTYNDASAMEEVTYMLGNNNQVSFHYAIDDKEVVQGIEENKNTWNAGDGVNGYGNRKTISIEICYSKSGGDRFNKAEENAAIFIASLLKKYHLDISKVGKHQDRNGKYCPHRTLDLGWDRFINMIKQNMNKCDQILRIGSIVKINKILKVTGVDAKRNLITIEELTGTPSAYYHYFDPTNFDVVDKNGNKTKNQVCYKNCLVKLNGEYKVLDLYKTEDWACKLKIGNRINWVWTEPCYEIKD